MGSGISGLTALWSLKETGNEGCISKRVWVTLEVMPRQWAKALLYKFEHGGYFALGYRGMSPSLVLTLFQANKRSSYHITPTPRPPGTTTTISPLPTATNSLQTRPTSL
jgi:hypothetical protein